MKTIITLIIISFVILAGIGWVKNIIKFARCDFNAPYKAEIVHGLGIVTGYGAITGWINIGK